jgi:cardiolipin synthase
VLPSPSSRTPRENIYNLPNFLTVTRLVAAPATAYLLLHDHHTWAFALFAYAGVTDLVDGWMARKWKLQTVAGSVIDPMADKALMIILTVTLAVKGAIPSKDIVFPHCDSHRMPCVDAWVILPETGALVSCSCCGST